jgi:hypothetical protein
MPEYARFFFPRRFRRFRFIVRIHAAIETVPASHAAVRAPAYDWQN